MSETVANDMGWTFLDERQPTEEPGPRPTDVPRSAVRTLVLLAVSAATLSLSACSNLSCNKGKIEGQWKLISSSSGTSADNAALQTGQITVILHFMDDGDLSLTVEVPGLGRETLSGRYRLLAEDLVEFSDFPEQKRKSGGFFGVLWSKEYTRITISGDNMRLMMKDVTLQLTRLK